MKRTWGSLSFGLKPGLLSPSLNPASRNKVDLDNSFPITGVGRESTEIKEAEPCVNCKVLYIWGVIRRVTLGPLMHMLTLWPGGLGGG